MRPRIEEIFVFPTSIRLWVHCNDNYGFMYGPHPMAPVPPCKWSSHSLFLALSTPLVITQHPYPYPFFFNLESLDGRNIPSPRALSSACELPFAAPYKYTIRFYVYILYERKFDFGEEIEKETQVIYFLLT